MAVYCKKTSSPPKGQHDRFLEYGTIPEHIPPCSPDIVHVKLDQRRQHWNEEVMSPMS